MYAGAESKFGMTCENAISEPGERDHAEERERHQQQRVLRPVDAVEHVADRDHERHLERPR